MSTRKFKEPCCAVCGTAGATAWQNGVGWTCPSMSLCDTRVKYREDHRARLYGG